MCCDAGEAPDVRQPERNGSRPNPSPSHPRSARRRDAGLRSPAPPPALLHLLSVWHGVGALRARRRRRRPWEGGHPPPSLGPEWSTTSPPRCASPRTAPPRRHVQLESGSSPAHPSPAASVPRARAAAGLAAGVLVLVLVLLSPATSWAEPDERRRSGRAVTHAFGSRHAGLSLVHVPHVATHTPRLLLDGLMGGAGRCRLT